MVSPSSNPILETLVLFGIVFAIQSVLTVLVTAELMLVYFALALPLDDYPWTIVTSVYAHMDIGHLVSNSIGLILFGWPIARATTRVRFHAFFVTAGAIAGITQLFVFGALQIFSGSVIILGASGGVFALLGYLIAGNRISDGLATLIDVPRWVTILVFIGIAIVITWATASPGAALIAHFTGFVIGLFAGRANLLEPSKSRGPR